MSQRTQTRSQQVARVIAPYPAHISNPSNTTSYNNRFQDVNRVIECAICAATLYDPRILPCHHRFCRGCIERWINTSYIQQCEETEEQNAVRELNYQPLKSIACPLCHQSFSPVSDKFQVDCSITTIMDMLVEQQKQIRSLRRVIVKERSTQIDALENVILTRSRREEAKNMRIKMVC